jgi:hypothetical protein
MAKSMLMALDLLDRYLLGEPVPKADLVRDLLAEPVATPAAAPFYRALAAVGARAADEAFIALRLVLRGEAPSDAAVREVRSLVSQARGPEGAPREAARAAYRARVGGTV